MVKKEILTEFEVGERLDKAVATAYPDYSRSSIEKLIESGDILVNNKPAKPKHKLKSSDKISIDFTSLQPAKSELDLPIIFEDEDVVVINKPAGVLAHSKGTFNPEPTVASWLKTSYGDDSSFWQSNRAGIVHRLDRATSGVMILAKNEAAQKFLQKQFSTRKVQKIYLALVSGHLKDQAAIINLPIERNPKKPSSFRVGASGKSAKTSYKVIRSYDNYDLVELAPKTGRTHQLRVHLAYLGHPVVGDAFYAGKPAERLMLHAKNLEIMLPSGEPGNFGAPTPRSFDEVLQ